MVGRDPGGIRERIRDLVPAVTKIAEEFDATPAQLSIAFCLTHPATVTVLFGATSLAQLEENIAGVELFQRAGDEIGKRVGQLWLDRGVTTGG